MRNSPQKPPKTEISEKLQKVTIRHQDIGARLWLAVNDGLAFPWRSFLLAKAALPGLKPGCNGGSRIAVFVPAA
jgi:hypothetical protein